MRGHLAPTRRTAVLNLAVVASAILALRPVRASPYTPLDTGVAAFAAVPLQAIPLGQGSENLVSSNTGTTIYNGVSINTLIGADRFYNNGFTGSAAIVGVIDAGLIWNGQESLTKVTNFQFAAGEGAQSGEFDRHGTWVGATAAGNGANSYQKGIAYGAALWSGAISTSWADASNFNITDASLLNPYLAFFGQNATPGGSQLASHADVVNASWGTSDPSGTSGLSIVVDGLAYQNLRTTSVVSAGNSGQGSNRVGGPGSGYNSITVGATAADTSSPPYSTIAGFSSGGPSSFAVADGATLNPAYSGYAQTRAAVDIVAPGANLTLAYYGGNTGGANPHTTGTPLPPTNNPASNLYSGNEAGTSFASPIIAGSVALLADAAKARFSTDVAASATTSLVTKAILMNSADKLAGWTNNASLVGGVSTTTQGLDYVQGAGQVNLSRAYDQLLAGTTDVLTTQTVQDGNNNVLYHTGGTVQSAGWDLAMINDTVGNHIDYSLADKLIGGTPFTATLVWDRERFLNPSTDNITDWAQANLNLQLWDVTTASLVAQSIAPFNTSQQIYFTVPQTDYYQLSVVYGGTVFTLDSNGHLNGNAEPYGLAWSGSAVPEPGTLGLLGLPMFLLGWRRRGRILPRGSWEVKGDADEICVPDGAGGPGMPDLGDLARPGYQSDI